MKEENTETEFILSWDNIANTFSQFDLDRKDDILTLIRKMRSKNFDRTLRAGSSLFSLVLSRSRRFGLRPDQKKISFEFIFIQDRTMDITDKNGVKYSFDKVEYNDTIEAMLLELEEEEID
jgi:hypothetical protein